MCVCVREGGRPAKLRGRERNLQSSSLLAPLQFTCSWIITQKGAKNHPQKNQPYPPNHPNSHSLSSAENAVKSCTSYQISFLVSIQTLTLLRMPILPDNQSQRSCNLALDRPIVLPSIFPYYTAEEKADREFLSGTSHSQDLISLQLFLCSIQLDILDFPKQAFGNS